ncbi:MAG: AGCS family alanine or glycine:cation symporter, partial [Cycloclasticus sp.]
METLTQQLNSISSFVWGPVILVLLLGVGLYLMVGLVFMPLRQIPAAFSLLWRGRQGNVLAEGEISPFSALMTSLAATIGTGNIAGVATAIFLGGPGAIFWMWMTALVGMATKYAEAVLAVNYREVDENGAYVGGPMYYI